MQLQLRLVPSRVRLLTLKQLSLHLYAGSKDAMTTHAIPLVGRATELIEFDSALARAKKGQGSIVLVSGEAGIGKTRLCDEVQRGHQQHGGIALPGRMAPQESS